MKKIARILFSFFIKGLLFVTPLFISGYIIFWGIAKIDSVVDLGIPGAGLLIVITILILAGVLATYLITDPIITYLEKLIKRIPLFDMLYTSIKDFMQAFVGKDKKFTEPVLVTMNEIGIKKVGFITQNDLSQLGLTGHVGVYFPHSYNFSGEFFIVPSEHVKALSINPGNTMKFIVSGGVSDL